MSSAGSRAESFVNFGRQATESPPPQPFQSGGSLSLDATLEHALLCALLAGSLYESCHGSALVGTRRLVGGEQRERVARILDDHVLEVLVVADRVRHAPRPVVLFR